MSREPNRGPRTRREQRTVGAMIDLYCRDHHGGSALCAECQELRDYAFRRLECCPFGEEKTTCAKCPVHCYKADLRDRVKEVMRYAGPRMLWRHPILALLHQWDSLVRRARRTRNGDRSSESET